MSAAESPAFSPSPAWERRQQWLAGGLIAAAGVGAYLDSFDGPFVYDDINSIPYNPTIRHLWPLWRALSPPEPRWTVSGRPILNLSLAINHAISGTDVWSYHLFNLIIHILAGLTLFGIVRRTAGKFVPPAVNGTAFALVAALLWTVHPLQTESVTYTIQRAESLMGLFYLLTLYCFIRATAAEASDPGSPVVGGKAPHAPSAWWWGSLAWMSCLLGMATKEVMVSAPVMVFLYDRTFISGSFRAAWRRHWPLFTAFAATWIELAYLVHAEGNRGGSAGAGIGVAWWSYALTQFPAVVNYLRLALWPANLEFDYGTEWVRDPAAVIPQAALVLALVVGTLYALWRKPALGFLGAWFFAILAPTSLVPGNRQTMAEHRMYLALAPIVVLGVYAATRWLGKRGLVLLLVAAAVLGFATSQRNQVYRSDLALWSDSVDKRPGNWQARDNLGAILANAGRLPEAAEQFAAVLAVKPDDFFALNNAGILAMQTHRPAEAVPRLEAAIRVKPDFAPAHYNLGSAFLQTGRPAEAMEQYREALRIDPNHAAAHFNYGYLLEQQGRWSEAAAQFRDFLRLEPNYAPARAELARALRELGQAAAEPPQAR